MGYVTLSFSDNKIVRHIKPDDMEIDQFSKFEIVFSASGKTDVSFERTNSNLSDPYYVPEGTWTLTIFAYINDINTGDKIVADGIASNIDVVAGTNTSVTITLSAKATGGNGTFSWDIGFGFTANPAKADLYIYNNNDVEVEHFNLLGTANPDFPIGGTAIASGNYQVKIEIISSNPVHQPIIYFETLDVYENLNSRLTISFDDTYYFKLFVYFDPNNGDPRFTQDTGVFVSKGAILTSPASIVKTGAYLYEGTTTNSSGYVLEGWYNGDTKWNFADPVETSMILKAKWVLPSGAIDVSAASGSNDVEKAIKYVNENAAAGREYVLMVDAPSSSIGMQYISNNNFNLTISGIDNTKIILQSNSVFVTGSLTIGKNICIEDLFTVYSDFNFTLSENSEIKAINLNTQNGTGNAVLNITSGWNGKVGTINLRGESSIVNDVIEFRIDKPLIKIETGVLTPAIINYFNDVLGHFMTSGTNKQLISDTYKIDNNGVLKIAASNTQGLEFEKLSDNSGYSVIGIGDATDTDIIIPAIYEGLPVKSIGEVAFYECNNITSIKIPDSVTSIGFGAFAECINLISINIPAGVTSIGMAAFISCSSLESITIPAGVTSIEAGMFSECSSLISVSLPAGITSIGESAFYQCSSLTSIVLPASVISIGNDVFRRCSKLTSIVLPADVTSIGENAFSDCAELTSISIPAGVTSIGKGAFSSCMKLTSVVIPAGITSIENNTFNNCQSLTSITIPSGVTSIGSLAFIGCNNLTSVIFEGTTPINFIMEDSKDPLPPFPGDLHTKHSALGGGAGTYTRTSGSSFTWTKMSMLAVSDLAGWNAALNEIRNGGNNKDYIIDINGNIQIASGTNTFGTATNINVTLSGSGTLTIDNPGYMFDVSAGQTLTIDGDITMQGRSDNNRSLISVRGTMILKDGKITGNTGGSGSGVEVSNGTLKMEGGEISGNDAGGAGGSGAGGGVLVQSGTFEMSGGFIRNNIARGSGGGVQIYGGTFIMTGGEISGNTGTGLGGGVSVYEILSTVIFNKTGGIITGSNGPNPNYTTSQGQAVHLGGTTGTSVPTRTRNTTADASVVLGWNGTTATGGWD